MFIDSLYFEFYKYYFQSIIILYSIFLKEKIKFKDLNLCKNNLIDEKINIIKFKDLYFGKNIF